MWFLFLPNVAFLVHCINWALLLSGTSLHYFPCLLFWNSSVIGWQGGTEVTSLRP
jgi:hypothetical protein